MKSDIKYAFPALVGVLLFLVCLLSFAGVVAKADGGGGVAVYLFSEQGIMCTGDAKRGQYHEKDGKKIEGCWKPMSDGSGRIQLVFTDGDILVLPMDVFKESKGV